MDENWNMYGKYKVYSEDRKLWVEVEFRDGLVFGKTNADEIFIIKDISEEMKQEIIS